MFLGVALKLIPHCRQIDNSENREKIYFTSMIFVTAINNKLNNFTSEVKYIIIDEALRAYF